MGKRRMKKWQKGMNGNGQRDRWVNNERERNSQKGGTKRVRVRVKERRERERREETFFFVSKGDLPRSGQSRDEGGVAVEKSKREEDEEEVEKEGKEERQRRVEESGGGWRRVEEGGEEWGRCGRKERGEWEGQRNEATRQQERQWLVGLVG